MKLNLLNPVFILVLSLHIFGDDTPDSTVGSNASDTGTAPSEIRDPSEQGRSYWDQTERYFSDPWTAEIGGNIGLSIINYNGTTLTSFIMDPLVNVFFAHGFFIGPIVSFGNNWGGGQKSKEYLLGVRLGVSLHPLSHNWYVCLGSGIASSTQYVPDYPIIRHSEYYGDYVEDISDTTFHGTAYPVFFNLKLIVNKLISVNVGFTGYITTITAATQSLFFVGCGVTGLVF